VIGSPPPLLDLLALSTDEYALIVERLGREPTEVELGMFGSMWSEHCGYKNSRPLLKLFPTSAPWVLQGPGENAGVVDIGDGLAVALKMESHNHPSAVEPFQGAATGVGGIVRDIFTMGARPIAILDALRFGPLDSSRNRHLFHGVVHGISSYGNCIGVPTVGGDIAFASCYNGNPVVNAMAVGVMPHARITRARASGIGSALILVGSDTGRDGIHGASGLASRELSEEREDQRPTVQVGNPFLEKLLIEACLGVLDERAAYVVGLQDLGAAGITSAAVELAARGGVGVEIDVSLVPRRESGMTAYDVMLSESQERMLLVVRAGAEAQAMAFFQKWGLTSAVIGRVTDDGRVRVHDVVQVHCDVPAHLLADAPTYRRTGVRPPHCDRLAAIDLGALPAESDCGAALRALLAHPNIACKRLVYSQYDHSVQTNTLLGPGDGDAAVLRIKGTDRAIALAADCVARYCYLEPYQGGAIAIAEVCRNVASVGARPLAITDCLNFGNPERPEIYYQLEQCIRGMADACRALGVPVVSGNVSLYNETAGQAVYPTPMVGAIGLMTDAENRMGAAFREDRDIIALLGDGEECLGGSLYLEVRQGLTGGRLPALDLEAEARLHRLLHAVAQARILHSCHDVSEGGLGVALAESAILGGRGARVQLQSGAERREVGLFAEGQSRAVVSLAEDDWEALRGLAAREDVACRRIGVVGGDRLIVEGAIDEAIEHLTEIWRNGLGRAAAGIESVA